VGCKRKKKGKEMISLPHENIRLAAVPAMGNAC
jgi:hypothetical protein